MFETLPNPSLATLLIAGRAVLLIGAFWVFAVAFIRWRRADERNTQHLHLQLERTFQELRSLNETVSVMGARLDALSERTESEVRPAPSGTVSAHRGYDLATRLARNGAPIEEITTTCGVTRHEAELLLRLHGAKGRETSTNWQARIATAEARSLPSQMNWPQEAPMQAPVPPPQPAAGRKRGSLVSLVG